ncbi:Aldo/keto reductase [Coniochaeta ligniaria NRRL 30616]|uniref:Aldo/keto reductase n=1 Tax=Coniochaeta ligniaria NRRL 30616 TaxID=1408157 RepID=A0A1J7J6E8_9PEZI|nr:Aldo/keto reductase [Coniochaeta ligniaria NRRL 30616]
MSSRDGKPDHGYPPLSAVLPPLILGTATFNSQYVSDPLSMPSAAIVSRCLELGITAFDTSPYYGPSESILGSALSHALSSSPTPIPRSALTLITKCGRIAPTTFDYSPSRIRHSVLRSLRRLNTPYLDLVYAHDVEFVTSADVLAAVRELRRLRDEDHLVRYVGISGFPVARLVELAEMIRRETGEGVDAVLSYGNFTVQNRTLGRAELEGGAGAAAGPRSSSPLRRFKDAGVDVVLNASMLGMGLLTSAGIPPDPETPVVVPTADGEEERASPLAKWHPSPPALRLACRELAALAADEGERLESVAIRWALAEWARIGALAGLGVKGPGAEVAVGATVMGVTSVGELEETAREWEGVLGSLALQGRDAEADEADSARQNKIIELVEKKMWPALGKGWLDYSWASPGDDFVNQLAEADRGVVPDDDGIMAGYAQAKATAEQYRKTGLA